MHRSLRLRGARIRLLQATRRKADLRSAKGASLDYRRGFDRAFSFFRDSRSRNNLSTFSCF